VQVFGTEFFFFSKQFFLLSHVSLFLLFSLPLSPSLFLDEEGKVRFFIKSKSPHEGLFPQELSLVT